MADLIGHHDEISSAELDSGEGAERSAWLRNLAARARNATGGADPFIGRCEHVAAGEPAMYLPDTPHVLCGTCSRAAYPNMRRAVTVCSHCGSEHLRRMALVSAGARTILVLMLCAGCAAAEGWPVRQTVAR